MRYLPDNNLSYPILLSWETGSGSGCFLNHADKEIYLVTARHVLFKNMKQRDADPDKFELVSRKMTVLCYDRDITIIDPILSEMDFTILSPDYIKMSSTADVAVIKIADLKTTEKSKYLAFVKGFSVQKRPTGSAGILGMNEDIFKPFKDVQISNDVVIFGYPTSLGFTDEIDYTRPLLRKGIVAGKNYKNNTIILDCPVYQGNSGGLAIEVSPDRSTFRAIGIISKFVPFVEHFKSLHFQYVNMSIENSGYSIVIPMDTITELLK